MTVSTCKKFTVKPEDYIRLIFELYKRKSLRAKLAVMGHTESTPPSDGTSGTVMARRTRQQARDDMYEALAQLARENCEINKTNTSHEYHRLRRAMQARGGRQLRSSGARDDN